MKNALIIGSRGTIGKALVKALRDNGFKTFESDRASLDLRAIPSNYAARFEANAEAHIDIVYICAAKTRFIDCEADSDGYQINVDAPMELARQFHWAKIIYLSSEAVERALHTNYGMHKALAEMGLRTVCEPVIARLSKVDPWSINHACAFLVGLASADSGVYRWRSWDNKAALHAA